MALKYLPFSGQLSEAVLLAQHSIRHVEGYKKFIGQFSDWEDDFFSLPVTSKQTYVSHYSFAERMIEQPYDSFGLIRSSGFSGIPCYWPQSKSNFKMLDHIIKMQLETVYNVHQKKTMAVVGLALGSWIGGESLSFLFKSFARQTDYPFLVFSPGNQFDEIIEILSVFQDQFDQFLVCICPSAIRYLFLRAKEKNTKLPYQKMKFIVLGESFSESLRIGLQDELGLPYDPSFMLSIYGSADTGLLGFESPLTSGIRSMFHLYPQIAKQFGFEHENPTFFHNADPAHFLEDCNGELLVTASKTMPLVRYNLKDKVKLVSGKQFFQLLNDKKTSIPQRFSWILNPEFQQSLGDLLLFFNRSDQALFFFGTTYTCEMFNDIIHSQELSPFLTGLYKVSVDVIENRSVLVFQLEVFQTTLVNAELEYFILTYIVKRLCECNAEFKNDWEHVYSSFISDQKTKPILIRFLTYPSLSDTLHLKPKIFSGFKNLTF